MRNPRFRAWDSKNKKFPFDEFHVVGEVSCFNLLDQYRIEEYNDLVIEQWTELKDAKGKDIYEGDIVRETWQSTNPYGFSPDEWRDEKDVFIVRYVAPAFTFPDRSGCEQNVIRNYKLEVIGNVHENPEISPVG